VSAGEACRLAAIADVGAPQILPAWSGFICDPWMPRPPAALVM
jgi:hypothetical protein